MQFIIEIKKMIILSLGAGVQSSTMALMSKHGEIEAPDCAIFADTGCEPQGVYAWIDFLKKILPFPVVCVQKGKGLKNALIDSFTQKRFASVPFFTESPKGVGKLRRQCTREYKIEPITKKIRGLLGLKPGERSKTTITQYIGISTDEAARMKPARERWINTDWPLIDMDMSRNDCINWLQKANYPIPGKSSCTFCPYHNDLLWRDMKLYDPDSWSEAVHIDRLIRNGIRGTKQKLYLHRSLKPLEEVDFRTLEDMGQLNFFTEECEGICGI